MQSSVNNFSDSLTSAFVLLQREFIASTMCSCAAAAAAAAEAGAVTVVDSSLRVSTPLSVCVCVGGVGGELVA